MLSQAVLKIVSLTLTLTILFLNTGCATITTGSSQSIAVSSTPSDAIATIDGLQIRTPGQVTLKKGSVYAVKVEKEGYEPNQVQLERSFNGAFVLNILWGPLIVPLVLGTLIDLITGAVWNISPESVHVTLQQKGATPPPK